MRVITPLIVSGFDRLNHPEAAHVRAITPLIVSGFDGLNHQEAAHVRAITPLIESGFDRLNHPEAARVRVITPLIELVEITGLRPRDMEWFRRAQPPLVGHVVLVRHVGDVGSFRQAQPAGGSR